jgi:Omp85 superfamily domain
VDARRVKTLLVSIVVLLMASAAAAQSTRVDTIAEQQAEKAKELGTEGPSEAEMIIRRVLLSPLLSGGDGVYPWFGSVYGGSGMGVGVGFLKRLEKASYFNVQTGISMNSSMVMRGTFAAPELWRGMLQLDANIQWLDAHDVSFYGFGQDSSKDTRDSYDFNPFELSTNVSLKPMRHVFLTGTYAYTPIDTHRETPVFAAPDSPGLDEKLTFHVARATLAYDWRPAPGYSTRGGYYRAAFERNFESSGRPYSFNLQEYEVVQQLPLVREQFVLAGRALLTLTDADEGHDVPVMLAPFLGSGSTLRAFGNRRFADRNRVLMTGEYRWRPSRYIDMAVFMDAGQVAAERYQLEMKQFDVDWGIGARFHGPAFNALRLELSHGREGFRLTFAGSQPF